jgi:hypothetical protein
LKVIFIVGLPGSGKTHHARVLQQINKDYVLIDDVSVNKLEMFIKALNGSTDIIATDPWLCDPKSRENAVKMVLKHNPLARIHWVFFENDPVKCHKNVDFRNDGRKVGNLIDSLTQVYRFTNGENTEILTIKEMKGEKV